MSFCELLDCLLCAFEKFYDSKDDEEYEYEIEDIINLPSDEKYEEKDL